MHLAPINITPITLGHVCINDRIIDNNVSQFPFFGIVFRYITADKVCGITLSAGRWVVLILVTIQKCNARKQPVKLFVIYLLSAVCLVLINFFVLLYFAYITISGFLSVFHSCHTTFVLITKNALQCSIVQIVSVFYAYTFEVYVFICY